MTSIRKYKDKLRLHTLNKNIYPFNSLLFQKTEKLHREETENSVKCVCGHSVVIPAYQEKKICNWCYRTVINTTKNHFKYKLRKKVKDEKKK